MFNLIEELRNAGAEVIAINEVRVVASTYIQDADEGLISMARPSNLRMWLRPSAIRRSFPTQLTSPGSGCPAAGMGMINVNLEASDNVIIDEVREATQK